MGRVAAAAAVIFADRSTATMCPDASRSHTRVTATPWPQPTSSTQDEGPGPS